MSEFSHDPYAPGASYAPPGGDADRFNEQRWRQVGASDKQLAELATEHASRSFGEKVAHNQELARRPDQELAEQLPGGKPASEPQSDPLHTKSEPNEPAEPVNPSHPPQQEYDGTVSEVLAAVGSDADRARAALAVEQARDKPRTSLVAELEKIAAG